MSAFNPLPFVLPVVFALAEMEEPALHLTTTLARATPIPLTMRDSIAKLPNVHSWDPKNATQELAFLPMCVTALLPVGKESIAANPSARKIVSMETVLDPILALAILDGLELFVKPQKTNVNELQDSNLAMLVPTAPTWLPVKVDTVALIALPISLDLLTSFTTSLKMEPHML